MRLSPSPLASHWLCGRERVIWGEARPAEFTIHQFFNETVQHRIAKGIFVHFFRELLSSFVCASVYVRVKIFDRKKRGNTRSFSTSNDWRASSENKQRQAACFAADAENVISFCGRLRSDFSLSLVLSSENFLFVFIKYLISRPFHRRVPRRLECEARRESRRKKCKST